MRQIVLAFVLLVATGCTGEDERGAGAARTSDSACTGAPAPHTPAEVVAALGNHRISSSAGNEVCEDGQRVVIGLFGDGLAGEENAVTCFVATTPAAQRDSSLFSDQARRDNVLCNTDSPRVHTLVVAALRELPG